MNFSWIFFQLISFISIQNGQGVYDGEPADIRHFKYMASLHFCGNLLCGGSIIDEKHILTAAHCVRGLTSSDITVIVGYTRVVTVSPRKRHKVQTIHSHPNYKPGRFDEPPIINCFKTTLSCVLGTSEELPQNDIAVLTLAKPLQLTENVQTIRLPNSDKLPYCTECKIVGWGKIDMEAKPISGLHWTKVVIVKDEYCNVDVRILRGKQFCAMSWNLRTRPGDGDSGGPLVCNDVVIGVISAGCCDPAQPNFFVNVYSYMDFINNALQK